MDALLTALEEWEAQQRRRDAERLSLLADLHETALGPEPAASADEGTGSAAVIPGVENCSAEPAAENTASETPSLAEIDTPADCATPAAPAPAGPASPALVGPASPAPCPGSTPTPRPAFRGGESELSFRSLRAQVAMVCQHSEHTAARDLDLAYQTRHTLPATHDALHGGSLALPHVRIIAEYATIFTDVSVPDSPDALTVEEQLADAALRRGAYEQDAVRIGARETPSRFRPIARRLAAMYAVKTLAQRHQEALKRRHVRVVELDDGMAELRAVLPAEEAYEIYDRLTRLAKDSQT
ncbi:DUF222 domain-containing protein, partial [Leucobacter sp. 7(1)]|uniref:DUF222 domain-containing protein n=1 Tax=Leucobacter sp. 7(1) TaxID=1255613 RepID=UPI0011239D74